MEDDELLEREQVLDAVGHELGVTPEAIEAGLYADLRDAHILQRFEGTTPEGLVDAYELGQAQAVLLRALKVTAHLRSGDPALLRELFRKLKFRRLLYKLEAEGAGYRLELDGPLSLFTSATKYGLSLALLLPTIRAFDGWSIDAEILWGKARERLQFHLEGERSAGPMAPAPRVDDLERLVARWETLDCPWRCATSDQILDLPGLGCLVPDLTFTHSDTGEVIFFELLGYWSRDAVWRRVELVQQGLKEKVLFAVSTRLRVSEQVLDDDEPSALYVFKGALQPKAIRSKLDELAAR